ncbi:MAG: hypothetical protein WKF30_15745 [Pyrinomonadaceae bacterium]
MDESNRQFVAAIHGATASQAPATVDNDFDQFTQAAPQSAVSQGLAEAFRSDQTPPFGNMLGQLFDNQTARSGPASSTRSFPSPARRFFRKCSTGAAQEAADLADCSAA